MRFFGLLALLFAGVAFGGTSTWSTTQLAGTPACESDSPTVAAALACHDANFNPGAPTVQCGMPYVASSSSGAPNYNMTTRAEQDTNSPYTCDAGLPNGGDTQSNAAWTFFDGCSSASRTYHAGIGGCAETCTVGSLDPLTGDCIPPPDCDEFVGVTGNVFFTGSVDGGPVCATPPGEEVLNCEALVANPAGVRYGVDGLAFARLSFTGDQCDGETDLTEEVVADGPGANNCISGGGVTLCAQETSQNCGTVNGEQVCFTSAPSGTCTFLGNGGMVCASDASAPPAPTEEDGETAATPTATFSAGGNDRAQGTFNYFGPGAVASSGSPTSGEGPPGELGGEEDDEGGEETECGPGCTLELPEVEDGEEAGSVLTSAISALEAGTLGDVLDEIRPTLSAGECPTASFEAWDQTFTFDSHCDFMESQRTVLAAMMLLVWSLLAFRILMET